MTDVDSEEANHARREQGLILESVHSAVLGLLAALPERPKRMRVRAAEVSVELDWRQHPGPVAAAPAVHIDQAGQRVVAAAVGDQHTEIVGQAPMSSFFICAPAVGTFYHAPDPGKPAFVVPGSQIEPGQQVGIVEAMKLMLPVEADRPGQVIKVLVGNGEPVQYGDQLIEIDPGDPA